MVEKEDIINFLRTNGIDDISNDDAVRDALSRAGWADVDIEGALHTLHDDNMRSTMNEHERMAGRNLFYSDMNIAPETLSSLLGIEVSLPAQRLKAHDFHGPHGDRMSPLTTFFVLFISLALGLTVIISVMYLLEIGPFYSPVA